MPNAEKANTDAREAILASIRQNLASSRSSGEQNALLSEHPVSDRPTRARLGRDELTDIFRANVLSVAGHCTICENEETASQYLLNLIDEIGAKRILISDSQLVKKLVEPADNIQFIEHSSTEELFDFQIGITGAQWAIAETGTLVLVSDLERNRLSSLVPPVHICAIRSDAIRQTMAEVLDLLNENVGRSIVFVTGPSRTSDIELTLAIGVHGPAQLYTIVIMD